MLLVKPLAMRTMSAMYAIVPAPKISGRTSATTLSNSRLMLASIDDVHLGRTNAGFPDRIALYIVAYID